MRAVVENQRFKPKNDIDKNDVNKSCGIIKKLQKTLLKWTFSAYRTEVHFQKIEYHHHHLLLDPVLSQSTKLAGFRMVIVLTTPRLRVVNGPTSSGRNQA